MNHVFLIVPLGARLLLEEIELVQVVSYLDPAEFGEPACRGEGLPLLRGEAICFVRLLLVQGHLSFPVAGVRLVPDLVLDLLELLDVVRVVHRVVLLEVVECWPGGISIRVCLRVEVRGSEGRPAIRRGIFGVHADDVFEGFDLVGLGQLRGLQFLLGLVHLILGLLHHNREERGFRVLLHQVINLFSFGFQHCLERVLYVE
jgi:hypothetical protein